MPGWPNALPPVAVCGTAPPNLLPPVPVRAGDLAVTRLRLEIDAAPFLASGDANPWERLPSAVRVPAVPVVLVVGSTLREAWVFGSIKWLEIK